MIHIILFPGFLCLCLGFYPENDLRNYTIFFFSLVSKLWKCFWWKKLACTLRSAYAHIILHLLMYSFHGIKSQKCPDYKKSSPVIQAAMRTSCPTQLKFNQSGPRPVIKWITLADCQESASTKDFKQNRQDSSPKIPAGTILHYPDP